MNLPKPKFVLPMLLLLGFMACWAGGDNVPADAPVEVELTVAELEYFDEEARKDEIGKVGQVSGIVMSAKRAAPNEKKFGSHFIHIYTPKGPGDKFNAQISCYTWGSPGLRSGQKVRLKGIIGKGAAMGYSLLNCHVERQ